jgi:hypothetical protein
MKQKGSKSPRPKMHLIFPTDNIESAEQYTDLMRSLIEMFPDLHFDKGVKGAAQ